MYKLYVYTHVYKYNFKLLLIKSMKTVILVVFYISIYLIRGYK